MRPAAGLNERDLFSTVGLDSTFPSRLIQADNLTARTFSSIVWCQRERDPNVSDTVDNGDLTRLRQVLDDVCAEREITLVSDEARAVTRELVNWHLLGSSIHINESDAQAAGVIVISRPRQQSPNGVSRVFTGGL